MPNCWWHPNRQTGLRCTRCQRPACPECLRDASVGQQCIDCVDASRRQQRAQQASYRKAGFGRRSLVGARMSERVLVTPVLVGINILVYVITAAMGAGLDNPGGSLFDQGVLFSPAVANNAEFWRLLTSGFLHYGLLHIGLNMLALYIIGRELEVVLGKVRFLALYGVSLLGGSTAVYLFAPVATPTAGASGAIFGLMGALVIAVIKMRLNATGILFIVGLNLVITFTVPHISMYGHLGGLVVGLLVMVALVYAPASNRVPWQVGGLLVLTLVLLSLIAYRDAQLGQVACSQVGNQIACWSVGDSGVPT